MKLRLFFSACTLAFLITGCASDNNAQEQLALLAKTRASVISSELPVEQGPLSIMRASAAGTTIEMMMIYNQDDANAIPLKQLLASSKQQFCVNKTLRENLDAGLSYRIKIRDTRGKLLIDESISKQQCL